MLGYLGNPAYEGTQRKGLDQTPPVLRGVWSGLELIVRKRHLKKISARFMYSLKTVNEYTGTCIDMEKTDLHVGNSCFLLNNPGFRRWHHRYACIPYTIFFSGDGNALPRWVIIVCKHLFKPPMKHRFFRRIRITWFIL